MMQTWPSGEAYDAYLKDCRDRIAAGERNRRDPLLRCEHGVSTLRTCKGCGVPEVWEDYLLRLWAAQEGPGVAEECSCGVVTRSDREWDDHVDGSPTGHKLRT
jgi:hypothetical protein